MEIQGCVFHWTQTVHMEGLGLGLNVLHQMYGAIHDFIRQVLALLFLPADHIPAMFETLADNATPTAATGGLLVHQDNVAR